MISQTAEYALRAVVHLAFHAGELQPAKDIAKATKVPAGYLVKVMKDLARAGILHSQRGLGGGFSLARDASTITVLDVLNAVDPPRRIRSCPLGLAAHKDQLCPLHRRLDEAMANAEAAFRATTIAHVTAEEQADEHRRRNTPLTISGGLLGIKPARRSRRG